MFDFCRKLAFNRKLLMQLTRRDLTAAYSGSVVGNLWVIVDPLVYVLLTLVFFQFAIKGGDTGGVPYVAWVLPVIIFWTFVNTMLSSSVGSIREYGYLLRHRTFDMRLVSIIKLMSAGFVHMVLMAIVMLALFVFLRVPITLRTLGMPYFFLSMCCLLLAMSWLLAALGTFWKDIRNLLSIFLQLEFWISPIFWEPERFPKPIAFIMYVNPFYYPIHGYRQSILAGDFGSHLWIMTAYFWVMVAAMTYVASRIFNRLSRSFGDVI
jgi:ABC-type polysaccharide/polyol phosphate export permease